jgi:hypothetical protein
MASEQGREYADLVLAGFSRGRFGRCGSTSLAMWRNEFLDITVVRSELSYRLPNTLRKSWPERNIRHAPTA